MKTKTFEIMSTLYKIIGIQEKEPTGTMSEEQSQGLHRRGSKASGKSVVTYEPFTTPDQSRTREIPTISVDQGDDEQHHHHQDGNGAQDNDLPFIRPKFTTETFGSSYSNSRTNTYEPQMTNEDSYLYRGESTDGADEGDNIVPNRLNDKVPSARPNVDYQDKLWTQIDVLDDVRRMGEQTTMDNNSFFNAEHSKAIDELRVAQVQLLSTIKESEKLVDTNFDHKQIWDSTDIEGVREMLYNKEYFDSIANSIDKVKDRLDSVGHSMKKIDGLTRDIWQR